MPTELSKKRPIRGNIRDTESIPNPPINDIPNAPLSGIFSEMKARVVGQKKVIPTANTPAAINTKDPDELASNCNPMNANNEERKSMPVVLIFMAIGPAKARPIIMIPLMKAKTKSALTPVSLSNDSIRCVVPSSVVAERSIQNAINKKSGLARLLYASI